MYARNTEATPRLRRDALRGMWVLVVLAVSALAMGVSLALTFPMPTS